MTQGEEHHCSENCTVALLPKKPAQGPFRKGVIFATNVIVIAGTSSFCHHCLLLFRGNSHLCPPCDYVLRKGWSGRGDVTCTQGSCSSEVGVSR